MNEALLERAQTVLARADQCLVDLGVTRNLDEIEMYWAYFLVNFERIFHRIRAAAGKGDAWYGSVEQFRKDDPLLCYLLHARNADEHGLRDVTVKKPGFIREIGAAPMDTNDASAGVKVTLEIQDPHVALTEVVDRSIAYRIPTLFRGQPLGAAHPLNVGLLGLSYASEVLVIARTRI